MSSDTDDRKWTWYKQERVCVLMKIEILSNQAEYDAIYYVGLFFRITVRNI